MGPSSDTAAVVDDQLKVLLGLMRSDHGTL